MRKTLSLFLILTLTLVATSCHDKSKASSVDTDLYFTYAERVSDSHLSLLGNVYNHVVVDASVYSGLMEMLDVGEKCIDYSDNMKLDKEKIIAANPDLLMLSAYDGADMEKFSRLGVPLVECRDFLESSALGRAEWMRFLGRLWGVGEKADSLFAEVENDYKSMCKLTEHDQRERSSVFFDLLYGNLWYQPANKSTIGQIVFDAGGKLSFQDKTNGGSHALSVETVLMEAKDADFWLIRSYSNQQLTLAKLAKLNPAYSQFKAFKDGKVFVCYTDKTHYFEETAFRPDWLLKDFYKIFHGVADKELHYFERLR